MTNNNGIEGKLNGFEMEEAMIMESKYLDFAMVRAREKDKENMEYQIELASYEHSRINSKPTPKFQTEIEKIRETYDISERHSHMDIEARNTIEKMLENLDDDEINYLSRISGPMKNNLSFYNDVGEFYRKSPEKADKILNNLENLKNELNYSLPKDLLSHINSSIRLSDRMTPFDHFSKKQDYNDWRNIKDQEV